MTTTHVRVETAAVRAHAAALESIATDLAQAIDAGRHTAVASDAFGIFCSFLVPHASGIQDDGIAALEDAASALVGIRGRLRASAERYDETDHLASTSFKNMVENLGSGPSAPPSSPGPLPRTRIPM